MNWKYWHLIVLILPLLTACTEVPYAPADQRRIPGGYRDTQVGPERYYIEIDGNSMTREATMAQYFHRRARELCGSSKYAYHYDFETRETSSANARRTAFSARHQPRVLTGEATCQ